MMIKYNINTIFDNDVASIVDEIMPKQYKSYFSMNTRQAVILDTGTKFTWDVDHSRSHRFGTIYVPNNITRILSLKRSLILIEESSHNLLNVH